MVQNYCKDSATCTTVLAKNEKREEAVFELSSDNNIRTWELPVTGKYKNYG